MATLTEIVNSKVSASDAATIATGSADYLGYWPDLTGAVAEGKTVSHNGSFWQSVEIISDIELSEPTVSNDSWFKRLDDVFNYVVSQFANGDSTKVAFISKGLIVTTYDYLIYSDGRVYAKGSVTGTFSDPLDFNPVTGVDSGLSGALAKVESQLNSSVSITMTDATYTLDAVELLYRRIEINGTLTAEQELVVGTGDRFLTVKNNAAFAVKVVCAASGNGVHVEAGKISYFRVESGDVLTDGVLNVVEIIPSGVTTSGTLNYPRSLTQSDFHSITITGGSAVNFPAYSSGSSTKYDNEIAANPTGWRLVCYSSGTDSAQIDYLSATSVTVSSTGGDFIGYCFANLNDGVTY